MKYNVIGYSNEVLGEVEADGNVEAWSKAGNEYSNILDVREMEPAEAVPKVTVEALEPLKIFRGRKNIWISGSHATGTATVKSDIDIVVRLPSFPEATAGVELRRQMEFARHMESELVGKTKKAEVYFVDEGKSVWQLGPQKTELLGAPNELWEKARPLSEFFSEPVWV